MLAAFGFVLPIEEVTSGPDRWYPDGRLLEEWNEAGTQGESDDDDPDGDERDAL